jgi:hypothetical protein
MNDLQIEVGLTCFINGYLVKPLTKDKSNKVDARKFSSSTERCGV